MLQARDQVPHFDVATLDGARTSYRTIWQQQNLVLVTLPPGARGAAEYVEGLRRRMADLTASDTAVVLTESPVEGLPAPALLVADRWGEIAFAQSAETPDRLPPPDEVIEWLRFTRHRCPECEGEWK